MVLLLLNIAAQHYGPVFSGIAAGLICKSYFAWQMQNKIKDYQKDIEKSREKVFELEALNDTLKKRLQDMEGYFSKDRISMN